MAKSVKCWLNYSKFVHFALVCFLFTPVIQVKCNIQNETVPETTVATVDLPENATSVIESISGTPSQNFTLLEPYCTENIRKNLEQFLKRNAPRVGRQDEGEDDGGDDNDATANLGAVGQQNPALTTLYQLSSVLPVVFTRLTEFTNGANEALNGTDTPNIPSFIVKQGMQAVQIFQAVQALSKANQEPSGPPPGKLAPLPFARPPREPPVTQRSPTPFLVEPYPVVPQANAVPERREKPVRRARTTLRTTSTTPEPEYYIDEEDVTEPATIPPTVRPKVNFKPKSKAPNSHNPFQEIVSQAQTQEATEAGQGPGVSLWNIYKSMDTAAEGSNGKLSQFQLAHPSVFSNELVQSISSSISDARQEIQKTGDSVKNTESELFKKFYPERYAPKEPRAPIEPYPNPEKSPEIIYKSAENLHGGVLNLQNPPSQNYVQPDEHSVEISTPSQKKFAQTINAEYGLSQNPNYVHKPLKNGLTLVPAASLEELQRQGNRKPSGPQFVKSPISSHLSFQIGDYVPAISSLHETDKVLLEAGPQQNTWSEMNGFGNKPQFQPVKNGVWYEAPRLQSKPIYQRPIYSAAATDFDIITPKYVEPTTGAPVHGPIPVYNFQQSGKVPSIPQTFREPEKTTKNPSTFITKIITKLESQRVSTSTPSPIKLNGGILSASLIQHGNNAVAPASYPNGGKFWMNKYYPNGVPYLTEHPVTTIAPVSTTARRRRRRTRSTTTTTAAPTTPEWEYYDEDEVVGGANQKKSKRRKRVTSTKATTEADFITNS